MFSLQENVTHADVYLFIGIISVFSLSFTTFVIKDTMFLPHVVYFITVFPLMNECKELTYSFKWMVSLADATVVSSGPSI